MARVRTSAVGIVHQGLEHRVADSLVLGDVGLQALQRGFRRTAGFLS